MYKKNRYFEEWILKLIFANNFQKFIDAGKIWIENECDKQNIEIIDYSYILSELTNLAWKYKRKGYKFNISYLQILKKRIIKNMLNNEKAVYNNHIAYDENISYPKNNSYNGSLNFKISERIDFNNPKIFHNMKNETIARYFLLQQNFRKQPPKKTKIQKGIFVK